MSKYYHFEVVTSGPFIDDVFYPLASDVVAALQNAFAKIEGYSEYGMTHEAEIAADCVVREVLAANGVDDLPDSSNLILPAVMDEWLEHPIEAYTFVVHPHGEEEPIEVPVFMPPGDYACLLSLLVDNPQLAYPQIALFDKTLFIDIDEQVQSCIPCEVTSYVVEMKEAKEDMHRLWRDYCAEMETYLPAA